MNTIELPLYQDFFLVLRENGYRLGVEEYVDFIRALQLGHGLDKEQGNWDKSGLLKLCKALWWQPSQSKYAFEILFEKAYKKMPERVGIDRSQKQDTPFKNREEKNSDIQKEERKSVEDIEEELEQKSESTNEQLTPQDELPPIKFVLGNQNEARGRMQVPEAFKERRFLFNQSYTRLTKRTLSQQCRFLPVKQASRETDELDVEASVHKFAEQGFLLKPIFKSQERIANKVALFIDHGGSMQAFDKMVQNFEHAILDAFQQLNKRERKQVSSFYFYNKIKTYCFLDKSHTDYQEYKEVLQQIKAQEQFVIVISDAGAARGGDSSERFKDTLRFVYPLKEMSKTIVWLNPLPKTRWADTSAERIARIVPMFELDDKMDLQIAMNILRGKSMSR